MEQSSTVDEKGHRLPLRDRANFRVLSSSAPAVRGIVVALNFAPILSGVFARTKKARTTLRLCPRV